MPRLPPLQTARVSVPLPVLYQTSPLRGALCLLLDISEERSALSSVPALLQGSAFVYHWVRRAQPRVSISFCEDPFVVPQGFQHQADLPAMLRPFPTGNMPQSHLQSFFFLLAVRTGASVYERNGSRFSPSLRCCTTRRCTHFVDPRGRLKGAQGISACQFYSPFKPGKEFL